ncbi:MAG: hypothetical protein NXI15_02480 [Gammaproteobacteria bacterium]|nr:hypothetical protein [Gammaproteobacteria bacterium]
MKRLALLAVLPITMTAQAGQKSLVCTDDRVDEFIANAEAKLAERRAMDTGDCNATPMAKRRCEVHKALSESGEDAIENCKGKPFVNRRTFVFDSNGVDDSEPVTIEIIEEGCAGEPQVHVGKMQSTSSFLTLSWTVTSSANTPVQRTLSVSETINRSTLKDSNGNQCVLEDREVKNQI